MGVLRNFLYNVSYQLLNILLPLITVPYISSILGAEGIGDYALTYANTQYFIIFGMVGITLYGNREIAYVRDNHEKLNNTFFSIYSLQFVTINISLILFIIFVFLFNKGYYRYLYIAQGISILASLFDISWFFMGLEQFKKTVIRNTLVKLISLVSIFIFVKNPEDVIIYTIILSLATLLGNITFWCYIPKILVFNDIRVSNLRIHFKSSVMLFIPQIAIQIYVLLDRTLLGILSNTVELGYYENSQKIVKVILTLVTAIGTVMMPKIASTVVSGDLEKVKYYIKNSFFWCSALAIPLMFGLMGVSKELSPWFFSNEFFGIENLVSLSSVTILAISWSNVMGMQLLIPLNKIKEFTISVTAGAIINLILNLQLIKYFGALGACISTIIAEFSVTFIQFYYVHKFIKIRNLIKPIILFVPASLIMFVFIRIIGEQLGAGILTNIIQFGVGGGLYYIIVEFCYRILKKESFIIYIKNLIN